MLCLCPPWGWESAWLGWGARSTCCHISSTSSNAPSWHIWVEREPGAPLCPRPPGPSRGSRNQKAAQTPGKVEAQGYWRHSVPRTTTVFILNNNSTYCRHKLIMILHHYRLTVQADTNVSYNTTLHFFDTVVLPQQRLWCIVLLPISNTVQFAKHMVPVLSEVVVFCFFSVLYSTMSHQHSPRVQ